jgi:hypothetical protein
VTGPPFSAPLEVEESEEMGILVLGCFVARPSVGDDMGPVVADAISAGALVAITVTMTVCTTMTGVCVDLAVTVLIMMGVAGWEIQAARTWVNNRIINFLIQLSFTPLIF